MSKSVKKNFVYNAAYQILIVILPLITSPYISRVLGAHNLGVYSYTHSIANYFVLFAMLGIKNYGNREIARVRDDRRQLSGSFANMYALQLGLSLVIFLAYLAYVALFSGTNLKVELIQSLFVLTAATDITWFFFGLEEFKTTVLRNVLIRLVSVVCIFVFVREQDDLPVYTFIMTFSALAGYLYLFPFLRRHVDFVRPQWREIKRHIAPNLRLFIPVIAVSLFNTMDKIMLGSMSNMVQVGLYENTEKLMRIPLGLITALGTVMMPRMSHMVSSGNTEKSARMIEQSMIFIMCLACSIAGGLAGVGKVFAPVFFGEEFVDCGELIMWISPTVLSLSWANVIRMQYLIPNLMDKEFTISTFIGAIVNLIVNYLLIPKLGALGAVVGTVCAEASLTIYQTWVVRKFLPIGRYIAEVLPFVAMGATMSGTVYLIGHQFGGGVLTLVIQIATGIILYLAMALAYLFLSRNESITGFRTYMLGAMVRKIRRRK